MDTVTRYAAAGTTAPVGTSTASYDGMGRLTGITHAPSASPSIAYAYAYDAANRMTSMTTPEGTSSFTLDATDQLLSASLTGEAYAYDKTGNRTSGGTQTGSGNRLAFDGTYRYAYDAEGNRTAKFKDTNAGGTLSAGDTDVTVYGGGLGTGVPCADPFPDLAPGLVRASSCPSLPCLATDSSLHPVPTLFFRLRMMVGPAQRIPVRPRRMYSHEAP